MDADGILRRNRDHNYGRGSSVQAETRFNLHVRLARSRKEGDGIQCTPRPARMVRTPSLPRSQASEGKNGQDIGRQDALIVVFFLISIHTQKRLTTAHR